MGLQENIKDTLLRHFKSLSAIIIGISAVIGFFGWWKGEKWREQYADNAVIHGLYVAVILYLAWIILSSRGQNYLGMPNVKSIHDGDLLIVEGAPWLSLSVMTAIYTKEDEFERLICVGEVINVQANKLVQIKIRNVDDTFETVEEAAKKLQAVSKDAILIRPGLYRRIGE